MEPAGSLLRLGACLACEFLGDFDCFEKFLGEERPGPFNAGLLVWQPAAPVEMRSVELSGRFGLRRAVVVSIGWWMPPYRG